MTVETVKIFQDGKWTEYKRDLSKQPLNIEDWFNATKLDVITHNYQRQYEKTDQDMDMSAVRPYIEGSLKFIVAFFRDQFRLKQAEGIPPEVMGKSMNHWYALSAGVMGSLEDKAKK